MTEDDLQMLPPTLRETHRYIVFEILSDGSVAFADCIDAIWDACLDLLGARGVADADPWVLKDLYDPAQQRGGIRVNKAAVEDVRAALALITEIDNTPVTFHVVGVTGTMDSARKQYFGAE